MATLDRRKMLKKHKLEKVFNMFDKVVKEFNNLIYKDGSGNIDASEIKAIF